jgi:hypothetical protein
MIERVGIQSSTGGTATTYGPNDRLEKRQVSDQPSEDQVELRSTSTPFEDTHGSSIAWDETVMEGTLSMIRAGSGWGIHGNLNPGRVASLLGDAVGLAMA